MRNYIVLFAANIKYFRKKICSFYYLQCRNEDEKSFKEEKSFEMLKILGLNGNI